MSKCSITFEDVKDDQVGMNLDLPKMKEASQYTGAVHITLLMEYIIKNGYHTQFEQEYYDNEMKNEKGP